MFQPVGASVQNEAISSLSELPSTWESHVYQLDRAAAGELGFAVGGVKITDTYGLLIMDTARVRTETKGLKTRRWGCGYRLVIEVSDIQAVGHLSLPAIAASVQMGTAEASVTLEVKGYKGDDLWDVIPPPKPLDVDTYKTYLTAAEVIQARFNEHPENMVEVLLAQDDASFDILLHGISDRDLVSVARIVRALTVLTEGATLAQALKDVGDNPDSTQLVESTYKAIRAGNFESPEKPPDSEREKAREYLSMAGLR